MGLENNCRRKQCLLACLQWQWSDQVFTQRLIQWQTRIGAPQGSDVLVLSSRNSCEVIALCPPTKRLNTPIGHITQSRSKDLLDITRTELKILPRGRQSMMPTRPQPTGSWLAKIRNRQAQVNAELVPKELAQTGAVPQINPLAHRRSLLVILSFADDDPVVSFRAGLGRREPDLLVWRLLVHNISTNLGSEVEG